MSCCRIVLAEGRHDGLVRYLDRNPLVGLWPILRALVSRDVREVSNCITDALGKGPHGQLRTDEKRFRKVLRGLASARSEIHWRFKRTTTAAQDSDAQ